MENAAAYRHHRRRNDYGFDIGTAFKRVISKSGKSVCYYNSFQTRAAGEYILTVTFLRSLVFGVIDNDFRHPGSVNKLLLLNYGYGFRNNYFALYQIRHKNHLGKICIVQDIIFCSIVRAALFYFDFLQVRYIAQRIYVAITRIKCLNVFM